MAEADRVLPWRDLLSPEYRRPTVILLFSIALHATNFFIFSTLAPSVVSDIGGLDLLSWATTLFVVSSIVSAAAAGILRAVLGVRRALAVAAATFALGSLITALAPDMETVLAGRTFQGIGAGLLTAYSHGMVRDLFPPASWARIFALISVGWGVAALTGPLIGGIFAEYGTWRWGFGLMVFASALFLLIAPKSIPDDPRRDRKDPLAPDCPSCTAGRRGTGIGQHRQDRATRRQCRAVRHQPDLPGGRDSAGTSQQQSAIPPMTCSARRQCWVAAPCLSSASPSPPSSRASMDHCCS